MSFDQDPNEQANISGADLAILIDGLKEAQTTITAMQVENEELIAICREFVRRVRCGEVRSRHTYEVMCEAIAKHEGNKHEGNKNEC